MGVLKKKAKPISGESDKPVVVGNATPQKHGLPKRALVVIIFLLVSTAVGGYLLWQKIGSKKTNEVEKAGSSEIDGVNAALLNSDKSLALDRAKKALDESPDSIDAILAVANLTKEQNPEEAKQYYAKALEIYKKENDLDDNKNKRATVYWAAAGLAIDAGDTNQAKIYYENVIQTANPEDEYEKYLAEQSKIAIEGLQ